MPDQQISATETTETAETHSIPFDKLPNFSQLFTDYISDNEALLQLYAGRPFSDENLFEVANKTIQHNFDRKKLVAVLTKQNKRWTDNIVVQQHINLLLNDDTVAVVTGQQVGLFGGPLYSIYKTLTTIQLAAKITKESDKTAVPVFWLEAEDHDFEEIATTYFQQGNNLKAVTYQSDALSAGQNTGAVGRMIINKNIEETFRVLDDILPPTDFKPALMDLVKSCYAPGTSLLDAFAKLFHALLPSSAGVVMISADDAELKSILTPLFKKELTSWQKSSEAIQKNASALQENWHTQINPRPTNIFIHSDEGRLALDPVEGGFKLRGSEIQYSTAEIDQLLTEHPEKFSGNVALRPLMQDFLLPTVAYVGGPGEVAYFSQLKPLYEWAGRPMPIIYPRASVSLIEPRIQKGLNKAELTIEQLAGDPERLFKSLVVNQMTVDLDKTFSEAQTVINNLVDQLKSEAKNIDPNLERTAGATQAGMSKELAKLKNKMVQAEKRKHETLQSQITKLRSGPFPEGKPQERALSPLYFINKYGFALTEKWLNQLLLDTRQHQVIEL